MKKYEYVSVNGYNMLSGYNLKGQHRDIIDRYAADGWRFVGAIPTAYAGDRPTDIDLVFEKDIDE